MTGNDLLRASLACRNFNATIGTTKKLMNKIRLHVFVNDMELAKNFLKNTSRSYEHIQVRTFSNYDSEMEPNFECLKNHNKWRTAKVWGHHNTNQATYTALFEALAANLEELKMNVFTPLVYAPVHFPKLKVLECDKIPNGLKCSTLKVLKCLHASDNNLLGILKTNKEIDDLSLEIDNLPGISILIIDLEALGIDLKLKKLSLKFGIENNYENFLKSQSHNLEELTIDVSNIKYSLQSFPLIFKQLKVLKKLIVASREFAFRTLEIGRLIIDQNLSITELRYRFPPTDNSNDLFIKVIAACPNITHLYVHHINQQQMEACSYNLKNLEFIYAFRTEFDSLPNDKVKFKNLKHFKTFVCSAENRLALNSSKSSEMSQAIFEIIT